MLIIADLVNCNACGKQHIIIERGGHICPLCGAIGCLEWANEEQEITTCSSNINKLKLHNWVPTDTEGHSYSCLNCGDSYSIYDEDAIPGADYTIDNNLYIEIINEICEVYNIQDPTNNIYTLNGIQYVELCT